jgi:hypothetical protein
MQLGCFRRWLTTAGPEQWRRRGVAAFVIASIVPGAALGVVVWIALRAHYHSIFGDAVAVRDYLNIWGAGQLIQLGQIDTLFHPLPYVAWLRTIYGPDLVLHTWSYPPSMALLAVPMSYFGLLPGYVIWVAGSLVVLWLVLRGCGLPWMVCLAVLFSPAAIENALAGQNGALTASMLEGGLLLIGRRPVVAGLLFGLLTSKPQLGLLVPVCLLASRQWVTIGTAAFTALLLTGGSAWAFGASSWVWYLTEVRPFMTATVLEHSFGEGFQKLMITPFILARWAEMPLLLAYGVQASISLVCIGITWVVWRRPEIDPKLRMALTASLTLLATPYGFAYDTIGTAVGVAVLGSMAIQTGFRPFEMVFLGVAWAWPDWAFWFGMANVPPIGCLTLAAAAFCAWRRLYPSPQLALAI